MDFFQARRRKEATLLGLVGLTAIVANLPASLLTSVGIDPRHMVALLGMVVVVALFLYLRFFFFLLYTLLAIGANLPTQWAEALGISQLPLLLALGLMIAISLLNYATKMMPTGLEAASLRPKKRSAEGSKALAYAIERDSLPYAKQVLEMDFDPNMPNDDGTTPLIRAAARGNVAMIELLLAHGADPHLAGGDGLTAKEHALKQGHNAAFDRIKKAQENTAANSPAPASAEQTNSGLA